MDTTNFMKLYNQKMQALFDLSKDIIKIIPKNLPTKEWENLNGAICELVTRFEGIGATDSCVPELHRADILFQGEGNDEDEFLLYKNLESQYPEFICNTKLFNCESNIFTITFQGAWIGDVNDCIRLTHHAEGLYENTNFEYVHVEVCIDGQWYGRR